jgi:D-3-phosphoglycerate dehydrogenase / 2-oxoglutarate reductase
MESAGLSLPKQKIKVLLLEGIHASAVEAFREQGYVTVDQRPQALTEKELLEVIASVHILGIRSATRVTPAVIAAGRRLMAIGCFCIGTNQVNLQAAEQAGIPVFNAPFSNTRSVAELVIGHIIYLLRGIHEKNTLAHRGQWFKSAIGSHEVRGKILGIVGYGRIGTQVGILAEALGMEVVFHDPVARLSLGNARPVSSLSALLAKADVVTLHVPEAADTRQMIGPKEIAQMKPGAKLINLSRGSVVDIGAAVAALKSKQLGGGAFDVFPREPSSNKQAFKSDLQQFDNVALTPHVAGSTEEAQQNIGLEVANKLITYSDNGSTTMAVNFPEVDLPAQHGKHRLLHIHHNQPGVLSALNELLTQTGGNIAGQYLQTSAAIGYVVIDIDRLSSTSVLDQQALRALPGTIKVRVLY